MDSSQSGGLKIIVLNKYEDILERFFKENNFSGYTGLIIADNWDPKNVPWEVMRSNLEFNYARNVNVGIRLTFSNDDIMLINDDVTGLTPKIIRDLHNTPGDIIAPSVQGRCGNPLQSMRNCGVVHTSFVPFICVIIKREVINSIGLLNPKYKWYGCEDSDYCSRATKRGFKISVNTDIQINHDSEDDCGTSFGRKYGQKKCIKLFEKAMEYYLGK